MSLCEDQVHPVFPTVSWKENVQRRADCVSHSFDFNVCLPRHFLKHVPVETDWMRSIFFFSITSCRDESSISRVYSGPEGIMRENLYRALLNKFALAVVIKVLAKLYLIN